MHSQWADKVVMTKIVSAHGNAVTGGQRPADRRTDA